MSLTPNDLSNLIAIRSLRDFAASQARIPGATQRQTAVLLLDGAIERTVLTACERLQEVPGDRDYSQKPMQLLMEHGWSPEPGVETDRRQLHRMRNSVQHSGVGVDPADLPRWVIASEKFIASVVRSAYGVEMDELAYSAAIEDQAVRQCFDDTEAALNAGEISVAAASVAKAFEEVMDRWSKFVLASNQKLEPRRRSYAMNVGFIGGDDAKVLAILDVAALIAIAPVPSEALWFMAAMQQLDLLNEEEVRRALVVAFTFATAVEASPAARVEDRHHREEVSTRLVRTHAETAATILDYSARKYGPRTAVTFRLKDVPTAVDYEEWSAALEEILNGSDETSDRRFRVDGDGTVGLYKLSDDVSSDIARMKDGLRRADAAVEERRTAAKADKAARREADDEFTRVVNEAIQEDLPSWLVVEARRSPFHKDVHAVVARIDHSIVLSVNNEISDALDRTGFHAFASSDGYVFEGVDRNKIQELIEAVVREVGTVVALRQSEQAAADDALQSVVAEFNRLGLVRRPASQ